MSGSSPRGDPRIRVGEGALVQIAFFVLGAVVLATMAIDAHRLAYFPGDVTVSHTVQAYSSDWLDAVLGGVSWIGFPPQSDVLFGVIVTLLFVFGRRWAAVSETIAAVGSGGFYLLMERVVGQPRPSADLVRVVDPIQLTGFPSGHIATFTAVFGFLAFLSYRRFNRSNTRWLPVALVAVLLAVMGFARIYAGHHWVSDVFAGCLLGALWLAVVSRLYIWGEGRLSHRGSSSRGSEKVPSSRVADHPPPRHEAPSTSV